MEAGRLRSIESKHDHLKERLDDMLEAKIRSKTQEKLAEEALRVSLKGHVKPVRLLPPTQFASRFQPLLPAPFSLTLEFLGPV